MKLWEKAIVIRNIDYYCGMFNPDISYYKDVFTSKEAKHLEKLFYYPPNTLVEAYKKGDYSLFENCNNKNRMDDINNGLKKFHKSILTKIKKYVLGEKNYKTIEAYLYAIKEYYNESSGFECFYYMLLLYFNDIYNDLSDAKITQIHDSWNADYKKLCEDKFRYNHKFWNSPDFQPYIDEFERYEFIMRFSFAEFDDLLEEIEENTRLNIESDEFIDVAFQMSFFNTLFDKYINRINDRVKKYIKELEKNDHIEHIVYRDKFTMSFKNMYTAKLLCILLKDEFFTKLYAANIKSSVIWLLKNQNIEGFWEVDIGESGTELRTHYRIKTTAICLLCLKEYNNESCAYAINKAKKWLLSQLDELGTLDILLNDRSEGLFYMLLSLMGLRETD